MLLKEYFNELVERFNRLKAEQYPAWLCGIQYAKMHAVKDWRIFFGHDALRAIKKTQSYNFIANVYDAYPNVNDNHINTLLKKVVDAVVK